MPDSSPASAPSLPPLGPDDEVRLDLERFGLEAKAQFLDLCRRDVNLFCEYVLEDEETGRPIEQHPFHVECQAAFDASPRLVVKAHPESGKTQQFAVGRVLWSLGRNPRLRACILGNEQEGAKKPLASIKRYIERSERLREVFPGLRRGPIWQDDKVVVEREGFAKDPSVQAVGYHGQIQGSRIDLLIADDFLDFENTRTDVQRQNCSKWFRGTVLGRLTRGARVAFLCNAWHPRDLSEELVKERGWALVRRPIRDEVTGELSWPERWTEARVEQAREDLGELEFARLYLCKPRDEGDQIFKESAIAACRRRGRGVTLIRSLDRIPDRCVVVTGCDIGGRRRTGGLSALSTVMVHPRGDRQLLAVEGGRWGASELIRRVVSVGVRFGGIVAVENNGVQQHLVDLARESGEAVVPIVSWTTGRNKVDPRFGVASLATELEGERWILPDDTEDLEAAKHLAALESEMLDYVPENHTGDYLMATWIAREVARAMWTRLYGKERAGNVGAQVVG